MLIFGGGHKNYDLLSTFMYYMFVMVYHSKVLFFLAVGIVELSFHLKGCEAGIPTVYSAEPFNATTVAIVLRNLNESDKLHMLIDVLTKRVSSQRHEIAQAYETLYNAKLTDGVRMHKDLRNVIIALLNRLPDYYAKELHDALRSSWRRNRNNDMIEILCGQNDSGVHETELSYEKLYGVSVASDLQSDRQKTIYALCAANRNKTQDINYELEIPDAYTLHLNNASLRNWRDDKGRFMEFLENHNHHQIRQTFLQRPLGTWPFEGDDVSTDLLSILYCIVHKVGYLVSKLAASMYGAGTDERTLNRIIITRSEIDLGEIKKAFQENYGKTLETWIHDDTSGEYRDVLVALVSGSAM